jgi:hypothetical protein
VICRQLGYSRSKKFYLGSHFGLVPVHFSYGYLRCEGHEQNIEGCYHSDDYELYQCGENDGAGVVCDNDLQTTTSRPLDEDSFDTNCKCFEN